MTQTLVQVQLNLLYVSNKTAAIRERLAPNRAMEEAALAHLAAAVQVLQDRNSSSSGSNSSSSSTQPQQQQVVKKGSSKPDSSSSSGDRPGDSSSGSGSSMPIQSAKTIAALSLLLPPFDQGVLAVAGGQQAVAVHVADLKARAAELEQGSSKLAGFDMVLQTACQTAATFLGEGKPKVAPLTQPFTSGEATTAAAMGVVLKAAVLLSARPIALGQGVCTLFAVLHRQVAFASKQQRQAFVTEYGELLLQWLWLLFSEAGNEYREQQQKEKQKEGAGDPEKQQQEVETEKEEEKTLQHKIQKAMERLGRVPPVCSARDLLDKLLPKFPDLLLQLCDNSDGGGSNGELRGGGGGDRGERGTGEGEGEGRGNRVRGKLDRGEGRGRGRVPLVCPAKDWMEKLLGKFPDLLLQLCERFDGGGNSGELGGRGRGEGEGGGDGDRGRGGGGGGERGEWKGINRGRGRGK